MDEVFEGPSRCTDNDSGYRTFVGCAPGTDARWRGVDPKVTIVSITRVHEMQLRDAHDNDKPLM